MSAPTVFSDTVFADHYAACERPDEVIRTRVICEHEGVGVITQRYKQSDTVTVFLLVAVEPLDAGADYGYAARVCSDACAPEDVHALVTRWQGMCWRLTRLRRAGYAFDRWGIAADGVPGTPLLVEWPTPPFVGWRARRADRRFARSLYRLDPTSADALAAA